MDLQERKQHLIDDLMRVEEEAVIYKLESVLKQERIKAYGESLKKPMTVEELRARAERSLDDIKKGRVTSLEDFLKESENWWGSETSRNETRQRKA